ncbi:MAG TPA: hypothetical protein VHQ42_04495 [Candidatus Limnocylindria bacterium]|nr:hypothetical protein [Candidatus Limnocylindria bacterium]
MSEERGTTSATTPPTEHAASTGLLGVLLVIAILRLVILLGWRDGGRA